MSDTIQNLYAPPASEVDNLIAESNALPFFAVALWKLSLMTVATLGFYLIYWNYKHWKAIKARTGESMWPVARAIFYPITCFELSKQIRDAALTEGVHCRWSPWMIGVLVIVLNILTWIREIVNFPLLACASLFHLIPLGIVQQTANELLARQYPDHDQNARLTIWNVIWLVIMSLLLVLILLGQK